jgi:hypothetical protein
MGLPHSKTLARSLARNSVREVVECGSAMPLSTETAHSARDAELHSIVRKASGKNLTRTDMD